MTITLTGAAQPSASDPRSPRGRRQRWWPVVLGAVIGLGLAVAYTSGHPRPFTSSARVQERPFARNDLSSSAEHNLISLDTESQLVHSDAVLSAAGSAMRPPQAAASLRHAITITQVDGSTVLDVSCAQATPAAAVRCAGAVAVAYLKARADPTVGYVAAVNKQIDALNQARLAAISSAGSAPTGSPQRLAADTRLDRLSTQLSSLQELAVAGNRFATDPGVIVRSPQPGTRSSTPTALIVIATLAGAAAGLIASAIRAKLR